MTFYLLSVKWTSPYVLTWWLAKSSGYTVKLDEAGQYDRKDDEEICRGVHGDALAIPCSVVDACATRMVHDNDLCELRNLALGANPVPTMDFMRQESSHG